MDSNHRPALYKSAALPLSYNGLLPLTLVTAKRPIQREHHRYRDHKNHCTPLAEAPHENNQQETIRCETHLSCFDTRMERHFGPFGRFPHRCHSATP
jgi:hypothetical protein